MQSITKRCISLLLALVMLFSLSPGVFATEEVTEPPITTEQPLETTSPTSIPTVEPADEEESSFSESTPSPLPTLSPSPEPTSTVTPELTPTPTPAPQLPELSTGMVDNLYPSELLEPDPYGIALLAQGGIPDAMWDNSVLRAMAYTGFNIQKLKDNGWLYSAQYISGQLKNNAPDVLSGIGYNETGNPPQGDEMVAGSSVTGKVPNIAHFRSNGMVCATYVSYYLTNYLPNIEGVDTSAIYAKAKSKGGLAAVRTWRLALGELASTPGSGVTKYTDAATAYANLVPGDIIVFSDDIHIAVFAGTYDLMSYGSSRGVYHFISHVGNSRGPEFSTAEYMADSTYKPSTPVEWYHLEFASEPDPGTVKVVKQTNTGANRNGWQFNIYSNSACTSLMSGSPITTNSSGEATLSLAPGDYWVKEVAKSDSYWVCDTSVKKITVKENQTSTATFTNTHRGKATIKKTTNTGANLSGWQFNLYTDAACTKLVSGSPFTSGTNGQITVTLNPGNYWVKEVPKSDSYWVCDTSTKAVTVQAGKTATVTFTNTHMGKATIKKTTNTGANLSGWQFNLYTDAACTKLVSGSPFTSGNDGQITVTLNPGSYWVKEVPKSDSYWVCDTSTKAVTVQAGQTSTVTFTNTHMGKALLKKTTNTGSNLSGWQINVYSDSACTKPVTGSPFTTGSNGEVTATLAPGTYWCKETPKDSPYWVCDTSTKQISVEAGKTATVTFTNTHRGRVLMKKSTNTGTDLAGWEISVYSDTTRQSVAGTVTTDANGEASLLLAPGTYYAVETGDTASRSTGGYWTNDTAVKSLTIEGGKDTTVSFANTHNGKITIKKALATDGTLKGWQFKVTDSTGAEVDGSPFTTDDNGSITTGKLLPGTYTVEEIIPADSLYFCKSKNPQTVTVKAGETASVQFTNALRPGAITIEKVTIDGEHLAGAKFCLEWSMDGKTWKPVYYSEKADVVLGGCSNKAVVEGCLTTGDSGIIQWDNLHPWAQYRVTEVEAPEGYVLLTKPAYEGELPTDNLTVDLRVVNCLLFTLPQTGSAGAAMLAAAQVISYAATAALIVNHKRKKK